MTYDFIGDVHGYATRLKDLLDILGYRNQGGAFSHPDTGRSAVFLGDLIDRGPQIRETLLVVRAMVESGSAAAIMGNHEYNAICFHTPRPSDPRRWMRPRTDKNIHQYIETMYQFRDHRDEWMDYLRWFKTLPLWLDLEGVRAVHAAWHPHSMNVISTYSDEGNRLTDSLLQQGTIRGNEEFDALQVILKGVEMPLPGGITFADKDGNLRTEMRVRWWLDARDKTYSELTFRKHDGIGDRQPSPEVANEYRGYADTIPVFFGHYWLRDTRPSVFEDRIACLDYSVAADGFLTAYTWSGEQRLRNDRFTIV
jgi:hypothetical protein